MNQYDIWNVFFSITFFNKQINICFAQEAFCKNTVEDSMYICFSFVTILGYFRFENWQNLHQIIFSSFWFDDMFCVMQ